MEVAVALAAIIIMTVLFYLLANKAVYGQSFREGATELFLFPYRVWQYVSRNRDA